MKITRRQLRRLIREAFSGYADERPRNPMERAYARRAEEEAAAKAEEDIDHSELEETLDNILLSLLRVPGVHDDALIGDPPHLSDEQQALEELQAHGLTADRAKEYITNFLKWAEEEGDEIDLSKLSRSGMYLDYYGSRGALSESTIKDNMKITRKHLRRLIKEVLHHSLLNEGTAENEAVKVIMQTPKLTQGWTGPRWDIPEGDAGTVTPDTGSFQDTLIVAMMEGGGEYLESYQTAYVLEIRSDGINVTLNVKFAGAEEDERVTSSLQYAAEEILAAWPNNKAALHATKPGLDYSIPSIPDGLELK